MAEIYTSSESASLASLSQEASDHINRVLADLGLTGTSDVAVQALDSHEVTAAPGDHVIVATPTHDGVTTLIDDGGHSASVILSDPGSVKLVGTGDDTVFASPGGNTIEAGAGHATIHGGTGDDFIFGGTGGGDHFIQSGGGNDTLTGGNGMDTLWGGTGSSELHGGSLGHTEMHAGTGGGDAIFSTGGFDTIYGGHATITESGGNAILFTDGDTVAAHGNHDMIDGSASSHASTIDVFGHHSTILGGAGNDTITLHDSSSGWASVFGGAGDDSISGSLGGHATMSGGTGNDHFFSYGMNDSMLGGDGSDVFTIAHLGTGHDTIDGGAGYDDVNFHDRSFADAHISVHDTTMVVSFDDGYSASLQGVEHLQFKDTVYNV